ncbi:MAG: nucleotidyltransferase family protein [Campylobacterales bacterium]
MALNAHSILGEIQRQKPYLQQHFGVEKIGLFGSYAKGAEHEGSDLDFYVEFREKNFDNIAGLWVYLETLFHQKIDLFYRHPNNNPVIFSNIQKEVVYG